MRESEQVEINVIYIGTSSSGKAIHVEVSPPGKASQKMWLPVSMISDQSEDDRGRITSVFLPVWLATEKGLV